MKMAFRALMAFPPQAKAEKLSRFGGGKKFKSCSFKRTRGEEGSRKDESGEN